MDKAFIFLCKLAWASRFRIPLIISVAFMAFDIRMQIEFNINTRTIRRRLPNNDDENIGDDTSEDSWVTYDEETEEELEELTAPLQV